MEALFQQAKQIIQDADVLLITAGAGMGVDSGLPDFRGNEGLWRAYPLLKKQQFSFAKIATEKGLQQFPKLAWALFGHMFDLFNATRPHEGFKILLETAQKKKDYFVVTSNIDSHFQKAGFDAQRIYEIHGRLNTFECSACKNIWQPDTNFRFDIDPKLMNLKGVPKCPHCGKMARPNVLLFKDLGYNHQESDEQASRFNDFMHKYDQGDHHIAILEFGAGKGVPSIRNLGEYIFSKVEQSSLIRVNPLDYDGPENVIGLPVGALKAIRTIC